MGKQKIKKGPTHKLPRKRQAEAQALSDPCFRPRIVRQVPRAVRNYDERYEDSYHRLDDD